MRFRPGSLARRRWHHSATVVHVVLVLVFVAGAVLPIAWEALSR